MISGLHIGTELRRFKRSRIARIAIIAICIMPILYSTLYLWSFWNPFGNVNKLPVALVNSDKGAVVDGKKLEAGKQVADGLIKDNSLNWQVVSHQEALDGVRDGDYYFALELPADFSDAIASPSHAPGGPATAGGPTEPARKAVLQATYNDANGYLSTIIGENAMRVVLTVVNDKIGTEAVDKLLVGLLDAGTGLQRAADGATKLDDGIGKLHDGAGTLSDGLIKAKDGTSKLADGTDTLVDGTAKLKDGSSQLSNGTGQLRNGIDQMVTGIDSAAPKVQSLVGTAKNLEGVINSVGTDLEAATSAVTAIRDTAETATNTQDASSAQIRRIADSLRGLPDPASKSAVTNLDALADQLDATGLGSNSPLTSKINDLADTTSSISDAVNGPNSPVQQALGSVTSSVEKLGQLQDGAHQLQAGIYKLDDGAHQLDAGLGELGTGAAKLNAGAHELHDGSIKLSDGAATLHTKLGEAKNGSAQLAGGLGDGTEKMPTWTPEQRGEVSSVMGGPVKISDANDAGRNTFGSGLAPFFFSLALYIGGIVVFFLLKPLQKRAIASGVSAVRAAIISYLPPALIGVMQALAVIGLTLLAVPMEPPTAISAAGLVLFAIAVSLMFVAINQMFITVLPPGPGRVASMAFLMLQAVASGGLYPIQTEPQFLQFIHPIMPMTYAVNGFRQVLYGGYDERLPIAIIAVCVITAGALALTTLSARRDRIWTMDRLHPVINI